MGKQNFAHGGNKHVIKLEDHRGKALIEVQNCTSLTKHKREAAERKANIVSYQETAVAPEMLRHIKLISEPTGGKGTSLQIVRKRQSRVEVSQTWLEDQA